ncbi:vWA domain-containing protein [Methylocystis heyeri]|uniref:VWA domain-containing protein n=1 Tax=Methylocystis heyeri TaxID=391905 RepID=A0A6B8KEG6_9HYPH|nr:vWA domain-containing protein [Methylocystis heyeri]QGM46022.1 VWA domain-containing protein [Methylocystis heyeri]
MIVFENPMTLWFAPLALAPLFRSPMRGSLISSIAVGPQDRLSEFIALALEICGVVSILALIIACAAPKLVGGVRERTGEGAELVFLIDRSGSMNETFAGRTPAEGDESKALAAKRILKSFIAGDRHDLIGVAAFSTAPMLVMPLTDHRAAIEAAFDAVDRPGLDYTNIGRGLAMGLSMFPPGVSERSRAIVLVSDGAGVIDPRIQDDLRADFRKANIHLYWLFLRTAGSPGIYQTPEADSDTPQAAPERHLDLFFKSLGVSYRAYEAEGASEVEAAIGQIGRLERQAISFVEPEPRRDLSAVAFVAASFSLFLLLLAKLAEIGPARGRGIR